MAHGGKKYVFTVFLSIKGTENLYQPLSSDGLDLDDYEIWKR